MKKKSLLVTILLLLIAVFAFSLTACNNEVGTLESLQNEYGIVVDGGSFEEGSILITEEIKTDTVEGAAALAAIADKEYDKDGSVLILEIHVIREKEKIQPKDKVRISIPNPNADILDYVIFHIKSDNSVEEIIPTVTDGKLSFEASSFSRFIIARKAKCVHDWGEFRMIERATCTSKGKTERTCKLCGATEQRDTPETSHNYSEFVLVEENDCLRTGKAVRTCNVCGDEDVAFVLGDHAYGEWIEAKEPTLNEEGCVGHYKCGVCGNAFDEDKNPIADAILPKLAPKLSLCLDGVPCGEFVTASESVSNITFIISDLDVLAGQRVTICDTENPANLREFTVSEKMLSSIGALIIGNIDPEEKTIRTDSRSTVTIIYNVDGSIKLSMDGYAHSGVVIEIKYRYTEQPVMFPMEYVSYYGDPDTQAYVFGLFGSDGSTSLRIIDMDTDTIYDYDDLSDTNAWDKWSYSRGTSGEIVFAEGMSDWWLAFDIGGDGKITLTRHNREGYVKPTITVFDGETIEMEKITLEVGSDEYNYYTWQLTDEAFLRQDLWLDYIDLDNIYVYRAVLSAEAGDSFYIGDDYSKKLWTLLSTVYVEGNAIDKHVGSIKDGYYTKTTYGITLEKSGTYTIEYLPFCNVINIFEMDLSDGYNMYLDGAFIPLEADGSGILTYEGLEATKSTNIAFFTSDYSAMPLTLSDSSDASVAHTLTTDGMSSLFFDKAGKFNLSYDTKTGILTIEVVELEEDGGSENGSIDDYFIFLSVVDYTNGNQTLYFTKNPDNENEVYVRVKTMAANSYISVGVMEKGGDYSTTSYGTLADTDSSIATNLTAELISVKVAGPIDVYFNFETKTVKIVAVSGSTEETVLPKDIYISTMKKYAFIENPDNSDELCYLGLVLESYDDFRIRDTDNNYITDITLASGTTGVNTNGSSVMVEADGTYNIYINKTTHEVRIVVVS